MKRSKKFGAYNWALRDHAPKFRNKLKLNLNPSHPLV